MKGTKPGHGWYRGRDGRYYPHGLTYSNFPGEQAEAGVFKVLAVLVIVAGVIAALVTVHVLHGDGKSNGTIAGTVIGIAGGRTVSASSLAFLGYVLQLLIAIHFDVRLQDSANAASALMTGVKEQLTVLAGRGLMATRASHLQPRRSYLELGICVLAGVVLLQLGQLLIGGGDAEERFVGRLH